MDPPIPEHERALNARSLRNVGLWLDARRVNQRELADHLQLSDATISKWLKGRLSPKVSYLITIAEFLGISLDQLIAEPPSPPLALEDINKVVHQAQEKALLVIWSEMNVDSRTALIAFLTAAFKSDTAA